jgi:aspartyl-tRNA synthetase
MQFEEKLIVAMLSMIKKKHSQEIRKYYNKELIIPKIPFPKVTFEEAKEELAKLNVPSKENDLSPEEEKKLCEIIKKEKDHEFVFVTEYPVEARPFYHMRLETNPKLTKSFDLLWNGLEITTGAQREHRYKILIEQAKEKGIGLKSIWYYLNFFKYGCPPHGGFGMGPTRMLLKVFDLSNVGEVTFLYRGPKRLIP